MQDVCMNINFTLDQFHIELLPIKKILSHYLQKCVLQDLNIQIKP